jgi:murein DD-endopeptidase MepM/ murein hydrolase activator NlpD
MVAKPVQKKVIILSQNFGAKIFKPRMLWLLSLSSIPLLSVVAAFGFAPQNLPESVQITVVNQEIDLPAATAQSEYSQENADDALWQADLVRPGDTLSSLLKRANIEDQEAIDYLRKAPEARALTTQLRPGQTLLSKTTLSGSLLELQFQISQDRQLEVKKSLSGYTIQEIPLELEHHLEGKTALISSSLFAATDAVGIPDQIAIQLANIFSSEIDFNQDLREGDHFSVVYETYYSNGKLVKSGRVLAAEFSNQGKVYRALLHRTPDGRDNYYTPDGESLQKAFLRSPLEFSRISSGFSLARLHPVLQTWRAHKGVDYAAPIGTRVRAVADATVSFVGMQSGYGNVVILQHANGISTVYGHLSKFAPQLRRGQKIKQGEIIGFVGMSGLATGPHLHYEFRVHGEHRNPLTVVLPSPEPLPKDQLAEFNMQTKALVAQLDMLRSRNIAALD